MRKGRDFTLYKGKTSALNLFLKIPLEQDMLLIDIDSTLLQKQHTKYLGGTGVIMIGQLN